MKYAIPNYILKKYRNHFAANGKYLGAVSNMAAPIGNLASSFINPYGDIDPNDPYRGSRMNVSKSSAQQALGMAGTGASMGAMFGPIGAGIGAGVGALYGAFTGKKTANAYNEAQKDFEKEMTRREFLADQAYLHSYYQDEGSDSFYSAKGKRLGKSNIHIKPENRGKFTAYCGGKVTQACINKAKRSSDPGVRKMAIFAENARKWKHADGGLLGLNIMPDGGMLSQPEFDIPLENSQPLASNAEKVVNAGTHEQGGNVPVTDKSGNLDTYVEGQEVIVDDMVFSARDGYAEIAETLSKRKGELEDLYRTISDIADKNAISREINKIDKELRKLFQQQEQAKVELPSARPPQFDTPMSPNQMNQFANPNQY